MRRRARRRWGERSTRRGRRSSGFRKFLTPRPRGRGGGGRGGGGGGGRGAGRGRRPPVSGGWGAGPTGGGGARAGGGGFGERPAPSRDPRGAGPDDDEDAAPAEGRELGRVSGSAL